MRGNELSKDQVSTNCDPVVLNKDLWTDKSIQGQTLDPNGVAFPCGMMAKSVFNGKLFLIINFFFFKDTFIMQRVDPKNGAVISTVELSAEGIAWPEDKKYKYNNLPPAKIGSVQWYNVTDERFMVWMRAAATPNFRKMWAKIKTLPLQKGTYKVLATCSNKIIQFFRGRFTIFHFFSIIFFYLKFLFKNSNITMGHFPNFIII